MRFSVGHTTADWSPDAGSVGRIYKIHIKTDGDARGIVHRIFQRVGHHFAHAALVNVAHGEDVNAGLFYDFAFLRVQIPRTDDHDVAGFCLGLESEQVDEFRRAITHDRCERHAMHVA